MATTAPAKRSKRTPPKSKQLGDIIQHARADVDKVSDPSQALFETTADC